MPFYCQSYVFTWYHVCKKNNLNFLTSTGNLDAFSNLLMLLVIHRRLQLWFFSMCDMHWWDWVCSLLLLLCLLYS